MDGHYHLFNGLDLFILNLLGMLNVVGDLIHVDVRLLDVRYREYLWCLSVLSGWG